MPATRFTAFGLLICLAFAGARASAEDALPFPKGDSQQEHGGIPFDLRIPKGFDGKTPHGLILLMPGDLGTLDGLGDAPYVVVRPYVPVDRSSGMWSAAETKKIAAENALPEFNVQFNKELDQVVFTKRSGVNIVDIAPPDDEQTEVEEPTKPDVPDFFKKHTDTSWREGL